MRQLRNQREKETASAVVCEGIRSRNQQAGEPPGGRPGCCWCQLRWRAGEERGFPLLLPSLSLVLPTAKPAGN